MELRSFKKIPLPLWAKASLFIGMGGGFLVFLVSLLSPVSVVGALIRAFIATLIVFFEMVLLLSLFSRYGLDSLIFGKRVKIDLRSFVDLKDFAWVYKTKREKERPLAETKTPSLEELISSPSDLDKAVEELSELAKSKPDAFAKALKIMLEEG